MKFIYNQNIKHFSRRIVVTGMGCVTPLGNNVTQSFSQLKCYSSAIRDLSNETYGSNLPINCKIGATIRKDFESKMYKTLVIYFLIKLGNRQFTDSNNIKCSN